MKTLQQNGNRPNLLVFVPHDLGRRLGCYDHPDVRSPNIDRFATTGIRFTNSFCTAPQCSPSRAALWTGRYPHANGVFGLTHGDFANDLHPEEQHCAQILRAAGYETHVFGFQHESTAGPQRCGYDFVHPYALCGPVVDDWVNFLNVRPDNAKPFFAQIAFIEPHRPFPHQDITLAPPEKMIVPPWLPDIPEVRIDLVDQEASIATMDAAFGRIMKALADKELADKTIVVFTSDHGIPFPHAKMTLYDPGLEIPLIIRAPNYRAPGISDALISNVDILPTLLELLELPVPSNIQGRSFTGLFTGHSAPANDMIFAEKTYHTYYDPMRTIRTRRWKLIANFEYAPWQETSPDYHDNAKGYVEVAKALAVSANKLYHPPFELFDLKDDPHEQHNLADDPKHRAIRDDLAQRLRQWMTQTHDPLLAGPMSQGCYRRRMAEFKKI